MGCRGNDCVFVLSYYLEFAKPVQNGAGVLVALLVYISFFAASFAPVMWVIISEIYPNRIKGVAMSFSTAVSWLCTFLTVYFCTGNSWGVGITVFIRNFWCIQHCCICVRKILDS